MDVREIGDSGIRASSIGLGCNNFGIVLDSARSAAVIHRALDLGITFFDMAPEHFQGQEEMIVGEALSARRKDVVIATKVGGAELLSLGPNGELQESQDPERRGLSRRWIMQAAEDSLRRLRTDYIDLYQVRVPPTLETGRDETLRALEDLLRQGKVRAIGEAPLAPSSTDFQAWQDTAAAEGLTPFVSVQMHYNLLVRDGDPALLPEMRRRGVSMLPYWPLANGLLSGKYRKGQPYPADSRFEKLPVVRQIHGEEHMDQVEALRTFAEARGLTMVELAIAWLLSEPLVASVMAGATRPEQVAQNVAAAGRRLSVEDLAEIERLLAPARSASA